MSTVQRSREQPNVFARELFDGLPGRYDALAYLLSFGQDRRWRRAMVDRVAAGLPATTAGRRPAAPRGLILDVATGPAGVALALARRTGGRIVGVDLTRPMLARAAANVRRDGRDGQVQLVAGRGEQLPFSDATFDAVSFEYLLRYVADPAATIRELARVLKPGGVLANLEFHLPPSPMWRRAWWFYTRALLPLGGAALGGREWYDVGRFLGPSIDAHYRRHPLAQQVAMWEATGLVDVGTRLMSLGGGLVMWGRKPA